MRLVSIASEAAHSGRLRRQRVPAAAVHQERAGPTDSVPGNHPTPQQFRIY